MATFFADPQAAAVAFTSRSDIEGGLKPAGGLGDPNRANHGVNQSTYDTYRTAQGLPPQDVALIAPAEVAAIYADYWERFLCGRIAPHSGALAVVHFDACFNGGGVRLLEETEGQLPGERDNILTPEEVDGLVAELAAGEDAVIEAYLQNRLDRFRGLHNAAAEHTWEVRLDKLATYVGVTWRVS